jgi:hypothetical protein
VFKAPRATTYSTEALYSASPQLRLPRIPTGRRADPPRGRRSGAGVCVAAARLSGRLDPVWDARNPVPLCSTASLPLCEQSKSRAAIWPSSRPFCSGPPSGPAGSRGRATPALVSMSRSSSGSIPLILYVSFPFHRFFLN